MNLFMALDKESERRASSSLSPAANAHFALRAAAVRVETVRRGQHERDSTFSTFLSN